jgi:hypothetical protein
MGRGAFSESRPFRCRKSGIFGADAPRAGLTRCAPAGDNCLDEVDAPLDDANVERFCDLLDEISKKTDTRFVTITHNPVTMARMDRLFGVNQAEHGISHLVSIDFGEAEKFVQANRGAEPAGKSDFSWSRLRRLRGVVTRA